MSLLAYHMARKVGMEELNLAIDEINHVSPNFILLHLILVLKL